MTDEMPGAASEPGWRRSYGAYPGWQIAASFLLGWALILAGALGVLYAPVSAWRTQAFLRHAVHAEAPIVAFKTYPPNRGATHDTYRPVVEIVGADGKLIRCLVGAAAYPKAYRRGDKIGVVYAANNPAGAVEDTTGGVWGDTVAIAIVSVVSLLIGGGIIAWMRYFVRHPPEHLAWIDRWFLPLKLLTSS